MLLACVIPGLVVSGNTPSENDWQELVKVLGLFFLGMMLLSLLLLLFQMAFSFSFVRNYEQKRQQQVQSIIPKLDRLIA